MVKLGHYSEVEVVKEVDFGFYIDGGPFGEILLPTNSAKPGVKAGDEITVFTYCDSEDRMIATMERPLATADQFAFLRVKDVGPVGAFLDWGLLKDLLVPYREQSLEMRQGHSYVVRVYVDELTERIVASTRLNRFLKDKNEDLEVEQEVDLIVVAETDLGWKVIVNRKYWGMVFHSEIFQEMAKGYQLKGFVKNIREDGKLDIALQKQGYQQVESTANWLMQVLEKRNGFLALTDKSAPELIYQELNVSKKVFKKAIGSLYKQRLITLEADGIQLVKNP